MLPEGNGSPITGCRRIPFIGIGFHRNKHKGGPQTANQTGNFEKDHGANNVCWGISMKFYLSLRGGSYKMELQHRNRLHFLGPNWKTRPEVTEWKDRTAVIAVTIKSQASFRGSTAEHHKFEALKRSFIEISQLPEVKCT